MRHAPSGGRTAFLGLGLAALFGAGCSGPPPDQAVEFRVPVFTQDVGQGTVEDLIVATGTLRANEVIALRTETSGLLRIGQGPGGRRLSQGDPVTRGDVVAEVTGDDVRLAARTEATRQRFQTAQADYESKRRLHDDGLLSDAEMRQVESVLADARLEWDRSQWTEARSRLVSPISGLVLHLARDERNVPIADGQLVPQGFVVAEIAPTRELVADVDLIGPDVARARAGLPARVRHHAWSDRTFDGRVLRLAPSLDPTTRVLRAEVAIDNREGLLRPGMFVEVAMVVERREGVAVVPREAVTERGGAKVVFVLDGQRVSRRDVALGLGDDVIVEVRSGVKLGDRVVVRGLETLVDGTRVRVSGS